MLAIVRGPGIGMHNFISIDLIQILMQCYKCYNFIMMIGQ
jgi:hypothetical protein